MERLGKRFLYPKLFQGDFAPSFYFTFKFTGFFGFQLYGCLCSSMLELDFGIHSPAFAKIVTDHKDHMGQIEPAMPFCIFIVCSMCISVDIITVKMARHYRFSVASQLKTCFFRFIRRLSS